ncbi:hypothetical protein [Vibrio phage XZ1]|nr:hypothetical protein AVU32_gp216 [Vibrio phage ValKK3]ALP47285.1 hypothetical protein phiGrn1_0160 [Vibrio phage phi-Grn1]ALP47666.1 hypothetical protein phiST2_0291 [Vibrio phage phi-ST2]QBX06043.1 hypothetical protein Va3_089 [Vibrio phage Va3]QNJ54668.1 hypothetical protein vBValMR10Z_127 [Vibrio phage vB_ValM_R10Z]QNJ55054.1 hypothetical protein vBValMR11Z_128 [Vibrio phage vB_ValM_R11Z]UOL51444.1 hypothetical protein [Vibrio phage XZ1]URQ03630.1 hypothetical protein PVA23_253 [Vibrio
MSNFIRILEDMCREFRGELNEAATAEVDYYLVQLYVAMLSLGFGVQIAIYILFYVIFYLPMTVIGKLLGIK